MKKRVVSVVIVCIFLISMVGFINENTPPRNRLMFMMYLAQDIYEISDREYDKYNQYLSEQDDEKIEEMLYRKFGKYFTEEGFQDALKNEVLLQGFKEYEKNGRHPVSVTSVGQQQFPRGAEIWYIYEFTFDTTSIDKRYEGEVLYEQADSGRIIEMRGE